jgi:hypothetical protein
MFFSASNMRDVKFLWEIGIKEILVSYFYIRKSPEFYADFIPEMRANGGTFMTDSGCFSFMNSGDHRDDDMYENPDAWMPYINEYVQWLNDNIDYYHVAVNMDLDLIVGREIVDMWNYKYFKPLENKTAMIYVVHLDETNKYADKTGIKRYREYLNQFEYIGINRELMPIHTQVYQQAKIKNARLHGFGWTSMPTLLSEPMFTMDSTTWLGGLRYGTSYIFDGANFRVTDYKRKHHRKADKTFCEINGINYDDLMRDQWYAVNKYNMMGWLQVRDKYMKIANAKLKNKVVGHYLK